MQAHQNPNPNPQIFTPNHNYSFFDFSNSINQQHQQRQQQQQGHQFVDLEKMSSINVGSGGSDCQFASPSAARSGRSVPRLVKVRRHGSSSSQRGRSSGVPFRAGFESAGGVQDLGDRYQSWKPFSGSDSGEKNDCLNKFDSSVSGNYESVECRNSGGFVFGGNSRLNSMGSVGALGTEGMERLKIGEEVEERASSSFNYAAKAGGFVFGSRSDKGSSLDGGSAPAMSKLGDDLSKLNIEVPHTQSCDGLKKNDGVNVDSEANVMRAFAFRGSGNVGSSADENADSIMHNEYGKSDGFNKTEDTGCEVDLEDGFTCFTIGSKNKNKVDSSGGGFAANKLSDEINNLNIKESGNNVEAGTTEGTDYKVNEKSSFVFGSDETNVGYSFGSNVNNVAGKMNESDIGSKVGDFGSSYSEDFGKTEDASFKIDETSAFTFGSDKYHDKYHAGNFVDDYLNELPKKIEKVHIGSKIGDSSKCDAEAPCSSSSFRISSKDREPGISTSNIFNASPTRVTFQAASFGGTGGQSSENWRPVGATVSSYSSSSGGTTFHSVGEDFECSSTEDTGQKSVGTTFHSVGKDFESTSMEGGGHKADSFSGNRVEQRFMFHSSFSAPKLDPSSSSRGSLYTGLNQRPGFSAKKGQMNRTKSKTRKSKSRQPGQAYLWAAQNYGSKEANHQENEDSVGHYSPMDFSPCEETLAVDQSSRETSVASEEHFNHDGHSFLNDTYPSVSANGPDEDLVSVTDNVDIDEDDLKSGKLDEKQFEDHCEKHAELRSSSEESLPFPGSENLIFNSEKIANGNDAGVVAAETLFGFHQNAEGQESDRKTQFSSTPVSEDVTGAKFTFAASGFSQEHFSAAKRHLRRKNRVKTGHDLPSSSNVNQQFDSSSMQFFPFASNSLNFSNELSQKGDSSSNFTVGEKNSETVKDSEVKQQSVLRDSEIPPFQEACEKWRLRGNQAYTNGDLSKAEEYYTKGVNCVFRGEMSKSCSRALMLCYSNRAVVRMAAGRMREALGDCLKATKIDHEFLKAQVRAANCHLALGEVEDAIGYFKKILPSGDVVCLDRKTVIEASTGLQKAQQLANYLDRCTELLRRKTCPDAESALKIIADALIIGPYSEKLLQMKAEALLVLRQHSELIQLCEQSLEFAEKNFASASGDGQREKKLNGPESIKIGAARIWRSFMISKSYFYMGKLDEALELLDIPEQDIAGNEAFQSGRHSEAIEQYTSAISCNVESRPFAAICFCNRAAAYQALGQITEAIADCSLAIALDGNYPKAISRRATLHELIRDYGQAVNDLQKFIFLLEKQMGEKANSSATLSKSTGSAKDLRQARARLSTLEEEARKGIPLNIDLVMTWKRRVKLPSKKVTGLAINQCLQTLTATSMIEVAAAAGIIGKIHGERIEANTNGLMPIDQIGILDERLLHRPILCVLGSSSSLFYIVRSRR
ncbi:hypothetical protein Syun_017629 [Stephania yunnanensis]|uniref:Uncharacterized protein n=1 Tax=Stephania yunnanensis TaxID=152371 RepID=A0AAP0J6W9_9MAGN